MSTAAELLATLKRIADAQEELVRLLREERGHPPRPRPRPRPTPDDHAKVAGKVDALFERRKAAGE